MVELEDTAASFNSLESHAARHRLPVFRNMKNDSTNAHPSSGRGTPHRTREIVPFSKISCHTVKQPSDLTRNLKELESSVLRRRVSPIRTTCGGQCDGVTCMLSTANVIEAPCLKVEEIKEHLGGASLDLPTIPIMDQLCPFHHNPSLWLVPRCSFMIFHPHNIYHKIVR